MRLEMETTITGSAATPILAEAWTCLAWSDPRGLGRQGVPPYRHDTHVIYITVEGEPVAVLAWNHEVTTEVFVTLLYVEPSSRRQGLAARMLQSFYAYAKGRGEMAVFFVPKASELAQDIIKNEAQKAGAEVELVEVMQSAS